MEDQRLDVAKREGTSGQEARNHGWWKRLKRWLAAHHLTLMTLPDTPHSIALGTAVGMFFGFTPLFGMKTLLSVLGAWLCKGNWSGRRGRHIARPPAAVRANVPLAIQSGNIASSGRLPESPGFRHVALLEYMEWTTFLTVGRPILVGSLFLALPAAVVAYFDLRAVLIRARKTAAN